MAEANQHLNAQWIRKIDDEWTFCGVLENFFPECARLWKKNKTQISYLRDYNDRILPALTDHDARGISSYTKEDYEQAIEYIRKAGQANGGGVHIDYAESTIQHYRHLIVVVTKVAARHRLCEDVLWGTNFDLPEEASATAQIQKRVKLKRSLTVKEELMIAHELMTDPLQRGEDCGLLLMAGMGLRDAEACAINYGDLLEMPEHPSCCNLWVYKTYKEGQLVPSGKTGNANRLVPAAESIVEFLGKRRKLLEEKLPPETNIDELPVVCIGDQYDIRCTSTQLTAAGRKLFKRCGLSGTQLAYIDYDLNLKKESVEVWEKDPTAYLFRRNFGTKMSILGLSDTQIQYVLGHDVEDPYETRNGFSNEEKLYEIWKIVNRWPVFSHVDIGNVINIDLTERGSTKLESADGSHYQLNMNQGIYKINISSKESGEKLDVNLSSCGTGAEKISCLSSGRKADYDRDADVLKQYYEEFAKRNSGQ